MTVVARRFSCFVAILGVIVVAPTTAARGAEEWTKPAPGAVDLACHFLRVRSKAEPLGVKKVEAGKAYEVQCTYVLMFVQKVSYPGLELGMWQYAILADGQTLAIDSGKSAFHVNDKGPKPFWTADLLVPWIPSHAGEQEVRCTVDIFENLQEASEANNACTVKLNAAPPISLRDQPPPAVSRGAAAEAKEAKAPAPPLRRGSESRPAATYPGVPTRRGQVAVQTYNAPTWQGTRVDWCLQFGAQCGEPAATEFCKRSGYTKATAWTLAEDVGPTWILADDKSCEAKGCDGFAAITCGK